MVGMKILASKSWAVIPWVAILLVCALTVLPLPTVGAAMLNVSVTCPGCTPGLVPAGSPIYIEYYSLVGHSGTVTLSIWDAALTTKFWSDGPIHISGGLAYQDIAPAISTPGSYVVIGTFVECCPALAYKTETPFTVTGGGGGVSTQWAILSVSVNPPAPTPGQPVTFGMVMEAISSAGPFPQTVDAECFIDGVSCGSGSLSYPGPIGTPFTVTAQTPWQATPGTHTLTWTVSTATMSTTFTVAPQVAFDFQISVTPTQQSVTPGGSTTYTVNVNLVSGTPQSVLLSVSGAPAGISASLNPTSGTPTYSSTLTVTTTSSAPTGTVTMTVTGNGGGVTHSATLTLSISQAADFSLNVSPAALSALQGQTASYSVSVAAMNGFNSQVALSVAGLPSGANGVFSVPAGAPDFSSTLTVTIPTDAPAGSYTLVVTGNGGGVSHVANLVLTVNQAPAATTSSTTTQSSAPQISVPAGGDIMTMLQQNELPIIGIIIILLLAIIALRSRKKPEAPERKS